MIATPKGPTSESSPDQAIPKDETMAFSGQDDSFKGLWEESFFIPIEDVICTLLVCGISMHRLVCGSRIRSKSCSEAYVQAEVHHSMWNIYFSIILFLPWWVITLKKIEGRGTRQIHPLVLYPPLKEQAPYTQASVHTHTHGFLGDLTKPAQNFHPFLKCLNSVRKQVSPENWSRLNTTSRNVRNKDRMTKKTSWKRAVFFLKFYKKEPWYWEKLSQGDSKTWNLISALQGAGCATLNLSLDLAQPWHSRKEEEKMISERNWMVDLQGGFRIHKVNDINDHLVTHRMQIISFPPYGLKKSEVGTIELLF